MVTGAQTPPMGWNSWDCFGTTVTEAETLANAQVMHDRLLTSGWDTIVVDLAWYDPTARSHGYNTDAPIVLDDHGRQLPAPSRFPSAVDGAGFGPLAAMVHDLGLKFALAEAQGDGILRTRIPAVRQEVSDDRAGCPVGPGGELREVGAYVLSVCSHAGMLSAGACGGRRRGG